MIESALEQNHMATSRHSTLSTVFTQLPENLKIQDIINLIPLPFPTVFLYKIPEEFLFHHLIYMLVIT